MSVFDRLLTSTPINQTAARVTSQSRRTDEGDLSPAELAQLIARLERKRRLLDRVLHIETPQQRRNLVSKVTTGRRTLRARANPRAVIEYVRIGAEMLKLHTAISAIRNAPEAKRARDDARAVRDRWWDSLTAEQQAEHRQRDAHERRRVENALTVSLAADHAPKHSNRIESTP